MSAQARIGRLEGLLARIQKNRDKPRVVAVAAALAPQAAPEPVVAPPPAAVDVQEVAAAEPVFELSAPRAALPEVAPVEAAPEVTVEETEFEEFDDDIEEVTDVGEPPTELELDAPLASDDLEADFGSFESEAAPIGSGPDVGEADFGSEVDLAGGGQPAAAPPESGRQAVALGASGDVDDLLEADISGPPRPVPTMEQLGETVHIPGEDAPDAELELDMPSDVAASPAGATDDLEMDLPKAGAAGVYDRSLAPPPNAAADLEAHRQRSRGPEIPSGLPPPSEAGPPAAVSIGTGPVTSHRSAVDPNARPNEFVNVGAAPAPATFVALIDASLRLTLK